MCLEISPLIVYPIIDRLLGGTNQDLFIPQRAMTLIEMRLIETVLDRAMTALEGARLLERKGPATLQAPFRSLVDSHDRLVYAGRHPASGELDQALHLAGGIVHAGAEPEMTP